MKSLNKTTNIPFNNSIIDLSDFNTVFKKLSNNLIKVGYCNNALDADNTLKTLLNNFNKSSYINKLYLLCNSMANQGLYFKSSSYQANYHKVNNIKAIFEAFNAVTHRSKGISYVVKNALNIHPQLNNEGLIIE